MCQGIYLYLEWPFYLSKLEGCGLDWSFPAVPQLLLLTAPTLVERDRLYLLQLHLVYLPSCSSRLKIDHVKVQLGGVTYG